MEDITIPGGKEYEKAKHMLRLLGYAEGMEPDLLTSGLRQEVDATVYRSVKAFQLYSKIPATARAGFLEAIGDEIEQLGDVLVKMVQKETHLPVARIIGERTRTVFQLKLFARLLRSGKISTPIHQEASDPDRQPLPKPSLVKLLIPIGPVVVFGAGNFPLAYSTAGGDTASALAAGCSVICKGHEAHPGIHALVAGAIYRAAVHTGMPDNVFQTMDDNSRACGRLLVAHPGIRAGGFTGSATGGRALFDIAMRRPEPIPFFAEMGSNNPVVILPDAMRTRPEAIAAQLAQSITLNAGQFCTNPGIIIVCKGEGYALFEDTLKAAIRQTPGEQMFSVSTWKQYTSRLRQIHSLSNIQKVDGKGKMNEEGIACPGLIIVNAADYRNESILQEEIFGPASILIVTENTADSAQVLQQLCGQLTVTIHSGDGDNAELSEWLYMASAITGRVIVNGVPTGVEVSAAMQHGGPWPAASDSRFGSVGDDAIYRWLRPVCIQNCPESSLASFMKGR